MNKQNNSWALGILQIITLAVVAWLLTNVIDVKERLARIEIQLQLRKAEK